MRLLNASTLQLEYFDRDIPKYVILSHTWGDGEVTFDNINMSCARSMSGYEKIKRCCEQAMEDGYDYVWIDTCCIDKRSSTELSESINSMYVYYKKAQKCYAYLFDVPSDEAPSKPDSKFRRSRWFNRGWTLQEMIAPEIVEFYSCDWKFLGIKRGLARLVEEITGIPYQILHDSEGIGYTSTAQKFSWLSMRMTTRVEDMAYCMLGIVGVNMPLLYGEGQRAFIRLQEELVKRSGDLTFLCWEHTSGMLVSGPFCGDPRAFRKGSRIQWFDTTDGVPFTVTNRGLEIQLPIMHDEDGYIAVVPKCCWYSHDGFKYSVGIRLRKLASKGKPRSQRYLRVCESKLELVRTPNAETTMDETIRICGLKMEYLDYLKEKKTIESVQVTNIKIAGIHAPDGNIQSHQFIAGEEIGSGTTASFKHNPLSQGSFESYEVYLDKCVGVLVKYKNSDIFIAFGLQTSGVWFTTRSDITENGMINALSEAFLHRKMMNTEKSDKGTMVSDSTTRTTDNGTKITISTRKKRNRSQDNTFWELNISIES